ncbi:uncharacterized protein LOC132914996 [Bombus pascuorum]|uniref:uncharacterized protein LOC132914996 n=1 Tax=Bombus pascuorum TaxID=65598 RepID=UPI00212F57D2|nr:uncharacterized protein LOC132914996 [Bombus pascuorum]
MPAPPPPPPPVFNTSGSGIADQDRNLLLQSIRAGKTLKKTVTVDKSAPVVSGRVRGESGSSSSLYSKENSSNVANSGISTSNGGPIGLGGLFSTGIPKLKPVGSRTSAVEKNNSNVNNTNFGQSTVPSIKRGPPPIPPPATQKPQLFVQKANSIPGQSTTDSSSTMEAPKGFGKPTLAPKPPTTSSSALHKPSPPPKKLNLTGGSVSRAQSMRLPRSPPVLAPTPPSLHQSQDCLNETQSRPTNRILKPPVAKPPSPPTSRSNNIPSTATRVAPPPPSRVTVSAPCIPPPPPPLPHRPAPTHQRLAPPPPPPPTPPTRSSSMRNGQTMNALDLEVRFADMFHSIANFPPPEQFKGFTKVYSSRNAAKQQAPAPPMQMSSISNTMVSLNTSSGG